MKNLIQYSFRIKNFGFGIDYIKNKTLFFTTPKKGNGRCDHLLGLNRMYFREKNTYVYTLHVFKFCFRFVYLGNLK